MPQLGSLLDGLFTQLPGAPKIAYLPFDKSQIGRRVNLIAGRRLGRQIVGRWAPTGQNMLKIGSRLGKFAL